MPLQAITFDLDDTLWAAKPVLLAAEQAHFSWLCQQYPDFGAHFDIAALRALRNHLVEAQPELRPHISQLRQLTLARALRLSGCPPLRAGQLAQRAFEVFMQARHKVRFFDHVLETLEVLRAHYRLGAVTNGNADIKRLGLSELFSFSVNAETVGARKPDARIYQAAVRASGCPPQGLLHIGDHYEEDVLGAQRAGWHSIWLCPLGTTESQQAAKSPLAVTSFRTLPAAIAELEASINTPE